MIQSCSFFNSDKGVTFLLFVSLPVRRITHIIVKHGGDEAWAKDEPVKFWGEVGDFHLVFEEDDFVSYVKKITYKIINLRTNDLLRVPSPTSAGIGSSTPVTVG